MWKKAKKNKAPRAPSHAPGFRELPPPMGIIAIELEFAIAVLFEEYPPGVIEGKVGTEFAMVEVDFIGIVVVEELTRVLPGMVDVEELTRVMPGIVDVEELMRVMPGMVDVDVEELMRVMPGMVDVDVEELMRVMPGMVDVDLEELMRVMPGMVSVDPPPMIIRQG